MVNPTFSYLGLSGPRTLGRNLGLAFEVEGPEVEGLASAEVLWLGSTSMGESASLLRGRKGFLGSSGSRRSLHLRGNLRSGGSESDRGSACRRAEATRSLRLRGGSDGDLLRFQSSYISVSLLLVSSLHTSASLHR